MNEVNIIINGVRYDAYPADNACNGCDLEGFCNRIEFDIYSCYAMIGANMVFKKSDKKFER